MLLVDDFPESVELVVDFLVEHGCVVQLALDGLDALRLARERAPDVIVMDFAMPRLDGLAATRALKGDPRTSNIPVVLHTGHPGAEVRDRARAAGCDAVVTKSASHQSLLDVITDVTRVASVVGASAHS